MKNYYYNLHNLLKIKTNFTGYLPDSFLIKKAIKRPDIIFTLQKNLNFNPGADHIQIAPGLFYNQKGNYVFSQIKIFNLEIGWQLKNLVGQTTEVIITNGYKNLIKMPVSSICPLNDYLKFILQIKLLTKNFSLVLGAALQLQNDKGMIISGCGNMGKTTTILKLVQKLQAVFLADDTIIVNGQKIYPYPSKIRFKTWGSPFLSFTQNKAVEKILPSKKISNLPVQAQYIFFLEKGDKDRVKTISSLQALKKILAINRKTLPFQSERTILAYLYSQSQFDLNKVVKKEEKILFQFLKNLKAYQAMAKKPEKYPQLITNFINQKS